jgi:hypothetical protein
MSLSKKIRCILILSLVCGAAPNYADVITYRGREYRDVVIEELSNQYVVHFPETGRRKYFQKEDVSSVEFSAETVRDPDEDEQDTPWQVRSGSDSKASNSSQPPSEKITLEEYRRRSSMRAHVEFEAAYEHWCSLSDGQRRSFLFAAENQMQAADAQKKRTEKKVAQGQEEMQKKLDHVAADIEANVLQRDSRIDAVYDEAYNDFDLRWNRGLRDAHAEEAEVMQRFGRDGLADGHRFWEDVYTFKANRSRAQAFGQANAQARQIARESNARIAEAQQAYEQLARQAHKLERRNKIALQLEYGKARRTASVTQSLVALEQARLSAYEPWLNYRELFSIEGNGVVQQAVLTVCPLLRIDWWVDGVISVPGQMKIRVYDAASGKLVTSVTSSNLPVEHFLILTEPGDYTVEVEAPPELTYALEGKELLDDDSLFSIAEE